jgi:Ni/Co efflux regulator RcnB
MKRLLLLGAILLVPATLSAQSGGASAVKAKAAAARAKPAAANVQRPTKRPDVSRPSQRPNVSRPSQRPNVNRPENRPSVSRPNNRPRPGNNGNRPGSNRPGNGGNNTVIINNDNRWSGNRVRGNRYNYPRGYRYHRHGIGHTLPRAFLTATYYYTAYAALGLIDPGPTYVWVRYGDDLLLVHRRTGYVRDVRYDVFEY